LLGHIDTAGQQCDGFGVLTTTFQHGLRHSGSQILVREPGSLGLLRSRPTFGRKLIDPSALYRGVFLLDPQSFGPEAFFLGNAYSFRFFSPFFVSAGSQR
jgi:hypothetical protein